MVKIFSDKNEIRKAKYVSLESGAYSLYFLSLITAYLQFGYITAILFVAGTVLLFTSRIKQFIALGEKENVPLIELWEKYNEDKIFEAYEEIVDGYEKNVDGYEKNVDDHEIETYVVYRSGNSIYFVKRDNT